MDWVLLLVISFIPPLVYMVWIRNTEKYEREQWRVILICFFWGASISVFAAIVLEGVLGMPLLLSVKDQNMGVMITAIVIAPAVEELTKPLAFRMRIVRNEINELEDGLIYGAVAGLGFSATENLLYGRGFLAEGLLFFLLLMGMRSIGGCLLHASATSLTGYGYSKLLLRQGSVLRIVPYFLLAILVHSFYNVLVSFQMLGVITGLGAAFLFVIFTIHLVRKKIRTLDAQTAQ